jgi:hypothetical protein
MLSLFLPGLANTAIDDHMADVNVLGGLPEVLCGYLSLALV